MNKYTKRLVENYIKNMNWKGIINSGVRKTMKSIISQYYEKGYLSFKQVEALRRTCIRSNNAGAHHVSYPGAPSLSATWRY